MNVFIYNFFISLPLWLCVLCIIACYYYLLHVLCEISYYYPLCVLCIIACYCYLLFLMLFLFYCCCCLALSRICFGCDAAWQKVLFFIIKKFYHNLWHFKQENPHLLQPCGWQQCSCHLLPIGMTGKSRCGMEHCPFQESCTAPPVWRGIRGCAW